MTTGRINQVAFTSPWLVSHLQVSKGNDPHTYSPKSQGQGGNEVWGSVREFSEIC